MHISSSELQAENLVQEMCIITFNTVWKALIKNNNKKKKNQQKHRKKKEWYLYISQWNLVCLQKHFTIKISDI